MILKLIISSHLPILGKVESSDLLRLLDLLLVGLDLALQLLNNHLHPLVVLSVLLLPVRQLLDQPLRFPQVLMGIREPGGGRLALEPWGNIFKTRPSILGIQLRLQLSYPRLHLGDRLLSTSQSALLRLIQPGLGIFYLEKES